MHQFEGFIILGNEDHVWLLKKSLYGLKQSPRQWYKRFDTFMIGNGYHMSKYNNCVYHKKFLDDSFIYLCLSWVNITINKWKNDQKILDDKRNYHTHSYGSHYQS